MTRAGLPHSEIPGSKVICTSPRLIAAYHVLHRLLVPRHSPCALCSLTKKFHVVLRTTMLWIEWSRPSEQSTIVQHEEKQEQNLRCESVFDCQRPSEHSVRKARLRSKFPASRPQQSSVEMARGPGEAVASISYPDLVGLGGVEPPTSRLSGVRSNQLSYSPGRKRGRPKAASDSLIAE